MSGALPMHDRVDVGPRHARVVERFLRGLADEARHRHVLARRAVDRLADTDDCNPIAGHCYSPSRTTTMFCCRHGPLVACATPRFASPFVMRRATSPMRDEPGRHDRVRRQRAARRVDRRLRRVEPERLGEDQLLVAELRVQLGDVDVAVRDARGRAGGARRLRLREVAHAEAVRLDAVLDPADPRRPLRTPCGRDRRPRARPPRSRR